MLIFGLLSPVSLIGSYYYDKRAGRKSHRKRVADYRETKARVEADAEQALVEERAALGASAPDPPRRCSPPRGPAAGCGSGAATTPTSCASASAPATSD